MTKIDLQHIIPDILNNVDFHNYLLHEGYSLIENSSNEIQNYYFKETLSFKEILYVSVVDGAEKYYSTSYGDSGDIIMFVKNRIELDETYEDFNPKKNNIIEACKKILLYLGDNNKNNVNSNMNSLEHIDIAFFKQNKKNTFTQFYNAEPIFNFKFLNNKGISQNTIDNNYFKNRIFNTRGLFHNENSYDIINTAFPLYNIDNIEVGLINMNKIKLNDNEEEEVINPTLSSDLKKGFWTSNRIVDHKTTKTKLTLVDDPIEALSHYEIFQEKRRYLSFYQKNEKAFEIINKLIKINDANLFINTSVNIENMIFDFRLICYLLSQSHPINFKIENNNHIEIIISDCKELKLFIERIQRFNGTLIKGVISSLGNKSKPYLQNEVVKASQVDKKSVIFKIPKTLQILYGVSKILTNSFNSKIGIISEKSTKFTWQKSAETNKNKTYEDLVKAAEIFGFKNINY